MIGYLNTGTRAAAKFFVASASSSRRANRPESSSTAQRPVDEIKLRGPPRTSIMVVRSRW